jgi:hypothetical protein
MPSARNRIFRQRVLLGVTAAVSALQALIGLFVPGFFATLVGFEEQGIVLLEIRATYGGFMAGMAVLLGLAVTSPRLRPGALMLLLCGEGGTAAGRIFAMVQLGAWSPVMILFLIYEIAVTVIAAVVLAKPKRQAPRAEGEARAGTA